MRFVVALATRMMVSADYPSGPMALLTSDVGDSNTGIAWPQAVSNSLACAASVFVSNFNHCSFSFRWLPDWRLVIAVGVVVALGPAM
jgi:hypothetical protein